MSKQETLKKLLELTDQELAQMTGTELRKRYEEAEKKLEESIDLDNDTIKKQKELLSVQYQQLLVQQQLLQQQTAQQQSLTEEQLLEQQSLDLQQPSQTNTSQPPQLRFTAPQKEDKEDEYQITGANKEEIEKKLAKIKNLYNDYVDNLKKDLNYDQMSPEAQKEFDMQYQMKSHMENGVKVYTLAFHDAAKGAQFMNELMNKGLVNQQQTDQTSEKSYSPSSPFNIHNPLKTRPTPPGFE